MLHTNLTVRMFSDLYIEYEGEPIRLPSDIHSITVRLLILLWSAGTEGISRELLFNRLYGDHEVENPSNSMRVNIFRLRKMLKQIGLPAHEYIVVEGGVYRWDTGDVELEIDVEQFENAAYEAQAADDREEKAALLNRACDLYTGDFLPALFTEQWVIIKSMDYQKLYIQSVRELYQIYMENANYDRAVFITNRALKLYAYEPLAAMKIDALIAQGYFQKAMAALDEISRILFNDLGVKPSKALLMRYEKVSSHVNTSYSIAKELKEDLDEKEIGGAYYCPFPSFVDCYRILKRMSMRSGNPVFLVYCAMTNVQGKRLEQGDRGLEGIPQLMKAIENALRSGDVYTRSNNNQFLIMLSGLTLENCSMVTERIATSLHEQGNDWGIKLDFRIISDEN